MEKDAAGKIKKNDRGKETVEGEDSRVIET